MMKLPIPIFHGDKIYTNAELQKPTPGILADVQRLADGGDVFSATHRFLSGCVTRISGDGIDIEERSPLSALIRQLPYRSAEYLCLQTMLLLDPDDGIEGVYKCPRCEKKQIAEKRVDEIGELLYDTRDHVRDIPVKFMTELSPVVVHEFENPVEIKNADTGETIEEIYSLEMRHPTIAHCIAAQQKNGNLDGVRFEWAVYVEALTKINDDAVENQWKNRFGLLLFERMPSPEKDLIAINRKINDYGMAKRIKKICKDSECGKEFDVLLNTSNFFDFAPRGL